MPTAVNKDKGQHHSFAGQGIGIVRMDSCRGPSLEGEVDSEPEEGQLSQLRAWEASDGHGFAHHRKSKGI
jgi:hypothetical protein